MARLTVLGVSSRIDFLLAEMVDLAETVDDWRQDDGVAAQGDAAALATPENDAALGWQPVTTASAVRARAPSHAHGRSIRTGTDRPRVRTNRS